MSQGVDAGSVYVGLKLDLSGLRMGFAEAKGTLAALGKQLNTNAASISKQLGATMTAAGAGMAAGLGVAVKGAAEFDQAMRNTNSLAKLSETAFQDLKKGLLAVADDPKIRQGPKDLAEGLYDVYSSGFQGAQALDIVRQSAYGASAGMTNTATSSRALMAVLNSQIKGVAGAREGMDLLFKTVDLGVVNFQELAGSIGQVLPTASKAGITLSEVGAAIAVMTRSGQSGSEAVNDLLNVITKIIRPAEGSAKLMKQLGIEYGITALQTRGLSGVLQQVVDKTRGNSEALAKLFPDMQAFRGVLSLTKDEGKAYTEMLGQFAGASEGVGATQKALAEQNKGTVAGWQAIRKEFEIVAVQVGDVLLPALSQVTGWVKSAVQWFKGLPAPVRNSVVVFTALASAVLLVGGPLLAIGGSIASLVSAASAAGVTMGALGAAVATVAAPVAAVGAAIALLVVAWQRDWGSIREVTQAAIDWIRPYVLDAWEAIKDGTAVVWGEIKRFVNEVWPPIREGISTFFGWLRAFLTPAWEGLKAFWVTAWGALGPVVKGVWDVVAGIIKTAWSIVAGTITVGIKLLSGDWAGAWDAMKRYLVMALDGMAQAVNGALSAIGNLLAGAVKAFYNAGKAFMGALVDGIKAGAKAVYNGVKYVLDKAALLLPHSDAEEGPLSTLTESGRAIPETLAEGIRETQGKVKDALAGILRGGLGGGGSMGMGGGLGGILDLAGANGTLREVFKGLGGNFSFSGLAPLLKANPWVSGGLMAADMLGLSKPINGLVKSVGGFFKKTFGFDDPVNDRDAKRWGFDFFDHFQRGVMTGANHMPSGGGALAGGGGGAVNVSINLSGDHHYSNGMDAENMARQLGRHLELTLRGRAGG